MRVYKAFIVIMASVILFLLPITGAMYDFQTDRQEDDFSVITAAGVTTDNLTLSETIYDADTTTISLISDLSSDVPGWTAYDNTSHSLAISGLTANATRNITVYYDIYALGDNTAINNLTDRMAWFWLLIIIAFAPAALAAIFTNRA